MALRNKSISFLYGLAWRTLTSSMCGGSRCTASASRDASVSLVDRSVGRSGRPNVRTRCVRRNAGLKPTEITSSISL